MSLTCLMPRNMRTWCCAWVTSAALFGDEATRSPVRRLFNRKYKRVGHLFQDRFKSKPVETDDYLGTVLRYVGRSRRRRIGLHSRGLPLEQSFLTSGSELVDVDVLATLVPEEILNEKDLAAPSVQRVTETRRTGRNW